MMNKKMVAIISVIVVIVIVIGVIAAVQSSQKPQQPQKKKLIRIGFSWPTYIDPAVGSDYSSSTAFTNLYDPLIFPGDKGMPKPWVVEKWEVSSDGLTWTLHIKKGIKFHSGNDLNADDVVFTFNRLLTVGKGYAYLFTPYIESVSAVDDYTVKVVLKKTYGPFISTLMRVYVVDKDVVMQHIKKPGAYGDYGDYATEWLLTHDAGSGPYMVKEVVLEDHVYMVKFKDYWGPMVKNAADEIQMLALAQPATEKTLLTEKQLEISSQWLPEETINALKKESYLKVATIPGGDEFYIMMNTKKPPLDDVHVRKAIAYAVDYQTIVDQIFPGNPIATGPVPSYLPGAAKDLPRYYYDLTKAKEELQKSKYWPDIKDNPDKYALDFHWIAEVPAEEKVAILFAQNMEEIGLEVNVVKVPWLSVVKEMTNMSTSPHLVSVFVAAHYPEAGSLLESRYHSKSADTWEQNEWLLNETLDHMIEDALSTVNTTERFKKYAEIEKAIMELCPSIFLFDHMIKLVHQDYVKLPADEGIYTGIMGYDLDGRTMEVLS